MTKLQIELQEGFNGETVEIASGSQLLARRENVRTRMQIGLADRLSVDLPEGPRTVEIRIPERGAAARSTVDAARTPFLGVSLREEGPVLRASDTPFRYM